MAKVIKGTRDHKLVQVKKGAKDIRALRCTRCKIGVATKVPDGKGGVTWKCQNSNCGAVLTSSSI